MNLILSVIVERAAEARDRDITDKIQQKEEEASFTKLQLLKVCAAMDTDSSYFISLDELRRAYDDIPDFRNFVKLMSVGRKDLDMIFDLLDSDDNGKVDYKEFCEELYLLSLTDQRWALADTKHKIAAVRKTLDTKLDILLSRFDARADSQDRQIHALALRLNKLMPSPDMRAQPIIPSMGEARLPIQSTTSTPSVADSADDAGMFQDLDWNFGTLSSQMSIEKLREYLQNIESVQQRLSVEVQEQAAAVHRQSEFIAQICESISCTEITSQHRCQEKVREFPPGDQLDRHGLDLGQVLGAVQYDASQLGHSIDRVGDLITCLGKVAKNSGVGPFPFDSVILNRISSM